MKRTILSLGVVAAMAVNTYGAGQVWYQATPNNANSTVPTQGAPGGQTVVGCAGPGAGSWNISVHYTLADGGATGWAHDHYANTGLVQAGSLLVPSNGFPAGIQTGSVANAGGILMQDQSGQNTAGGAAAGDYVLETFTLNSATCSVNVYAGVGSVEFGGNDPDGFDVYEIVQIGSNVPRPGFSLGGGDPAAAEPIAVIAPEPTTLALLALGGLSLIRRRK